MAEREAPTGEPEDHHPYVPSSQSPVEITWVVVVLSIVLSIVMASANAYLGLFAGITVSAAIPAAVVSMALLTLFARFGYRKNILQNNVVHTSASAGESLAAGIIFTLPALLIMGRWTDIGIGETILIAALGGSLGVLFTIPLRRAFIVQARLQYPEGIAVTEVLKSGEGGGRGAMYIVLGALIGAQYKFLGAATALWEETATYARRVGDNLFYMGASLSPALVGVGYIVGLNIAVLVFAGGIISWLIGIPLWLAFNDWPLDAYGLQMFAADAGATVWDEYIRYMGVGAMAFGGVYTLVRLRKPLANGIRSGLEAYRESKRTGADARPRTERDISMGAVGWGVIAFTVLLGLLYTYYVTDQLERMGDLWIGAVLAIVMIVAGFLFTAVAGYMAGVVGSSNNPISGVTIATVLFTAILLVGLQVGPEIGPEATIFVAATIAAAAAIAGDNMQDLKAGYLLGSTPRKLQIMEFVGVLSAAIVIPFTLILLHQAYGIGTFPAGCDPDAVGGITRDQCPDPDDQLAAPQANLMAAVSLGVFGLGSIPWNMFWIGVAIAVAIVTLDALLERRGSSFRTPVLAVAVGIYLPLELTTPIFAGGLLHHYARRRARRVEREPSGVEARLNRGVLVASGFIAGEALVGILVAGLIVALGGATPPIPVVDQPTFVPGLLLLGFIGWLLYYVVGRRERAY